MENTILEQIANELAEYHNFCNKKCRKYAIDLLKALGGKIEFNYEEQDAPSYDSMLIKDDGVSEVYIERLYFADGKWTNILADIYSYYDGEEKHGVILDYDYVDYPEIVKYLLIASQQPKE